MERNSRRQASGLKAGRDFGIALVWMFAGYFIMFSAQLVGKDYFEDSPIIKGAMKWIIGVMFMLYGVFRAYRGYLAIKKGKENDY